MPENSKQSILVVAVSIPYIIKAWPLRLDFLIALFAQRKVAVAVAFIGTPFFTGLREFVVLAGKTQQRGSFLVVLGVHDKCVFIRTNKNAQKWSRITSVAIWPRHTGPRIKVRVKYSAL